MSYFTERKKVQTLNSNRKHQMGYKKELKKNRFKNIFDPDDYSADALAPIEHADPNNLTWTYYYICYQTTPYGKDLVGNKSYFRQKKCNNKKELRSLLEYLKSNPKNSDFTIWSQKIKYGEIKQL